MKLAIALMLGMACMCQGQEATTVCGTSAFPDGNGVVRDCWIANKPAPLKCEKYQHVGIVGYIQGFGLKPEDNGEESVYGCVDDMHSLTEREWQALQDRLDASVKLAAQMHEDHERLLARVKALEAKPTVKCFDCDLSPDKAKP